MINVCNGVTETVVCISFIKDIELKSLFWMQCDSVLLISYALFAEIIVFAIEINKKRW